jgi:hypothetical protein
MEDFKSRVEFNLLGVKMAKWGEGDPRWIGVIF